MTTRPGDHQAAFQAWSDAREPELQRTAHLLTGDLASARAHVVSALARVLPARVPDRADLDPLALRALVTAATSGRPPDPVRAATGVEVALAVDADDPDPHEEHRTIWDFLATLSPTRRASLVLRLHCCLDEGEVAGLVGGSPRTVAAEVTTALGDLAALLDVRVAEAEALTTTTLRLRAEATPVRPTPYDAIRVAPTHGRRRRPGRVVVLAAVAVLVLTVPVAALSGGGLPTPPMPQRPTPSVFSGIEPGDRIPPPWVRSPDPSLVEVELDVKCALPADEESRPTAVTRASCRTIVKDR